MSSEIQQKFSFDLLPLATQYSLRMQLCIHLWNVDLKKKKQMVEMEEKSSFVVIRICLNWNAKWSILKCRVNNNCLKNSIQKWEKLFHIWQKYMWNNFVFFYFSYTFYNLVSAWTKIFDWKKMFKKIGWNCVKIDFDFYRNGKIKYIFASIFKRCDSALYVIFKVVNNTYKYREEKNGGINDPDTITR